MNRKISVIGLGYVGLPVAVAFGQKHRVVGFDVKPRRIAELKAGKDSTLEVSSEELATSDILFTADPADLKDADFHIVAVPTPITESNQPDLTPLLRASETVGKQLKQGDIVVFESTVYPGATEEDCLPILERESGLTAGRDFTVGYSPERINPGDKEHTFTKITKVVSGQDQETLDVVAEVYASVVAAGVHKAPSIKAAEAAKVIENTQRDLNIALMNELAIIFKRMNVDTLDVLEAAGTKWNFLPFRPGLVGGHCIGVDPYYLTYKAQKTGYHPDVILAGRRTNDSMGRYIVSEVVKEMLLKQVPVIGARVAVLGLTFKEDCPDLRNSRVADIINELRSYKVDLLVHDPLADRDEAKEEYGIDLCDWSQLTELDAIIIATAHREYRQIPVTDYQARLKASGLVFDIKGVIDRTAASAAQLSLWRL
ncbi:nucleotide sugar dehydrogenase [Gilvimarinus sp. F26214L]|uniref:nucleotide sugar dehydrogenase n=1 Tax=Gilvimarinus sp. DZF01 TaxID=3461371 RepID=UPI00404654B0